jgi:hypothetical protein
MAAAVDMAEADLTAAGGAAIKVVCHMAAVAAAADITVADTMVVNRLVTVMATAAGMAAATTADMEATVAATAMDMDMDMDMVEIAAGFGVTTIVFVAAGSY